MATFTGPVLFSQIAASPNAPAEAEAAKYVLVKGEVRGEGLVPWQSGMTLLKAVKLAGSIGWRSPSRVYVQRGAVRLTYELRKIEKGRAPDPDLLPGDEVIIPD